MSVEQNCFLLPASYMLIHHCASLLDYKLRFWNLSIQSKQYYDCKSAIGKLVFEFSYQVCVDFILP